MLKGHQYPHPRITQVQRTVKLPRVTLDLLKILGRPLVGLWVPSLSSFLGRSSSGTSSKSGQTALRTNDPSRPQSLPPSAQPELRIFTEGPLSLDPPIRGVKDFTNAHRRVNRYTTSHTATNISTVMRLDLSRTPLTGMNEMGPLPPHSLLLLSLRIRPRRQNLAACSLFPRPIEAPASAINL